MWHIKLVDIGGDGMVVDFDTRLETLAEVEQAVKGKINEHLHITCVELEYEDELIYNVMVNGRQVGIVVIKSVNAAPAKRK